MDKTLNEKCINLASQPLGDIQSGLSETGCQYGSCLYRNCIEDTLPQVFRGKKHNYQQEEHMNNKNVAVVHRKGA